MKREEKEREADVFMLQQVEALAKKDHVVLVIPLSNIPLTANGDLPSTLGLRFVSPEHLMLVFSQLLDKATEVWPDHELIREYQE